MNPVTYEEAVAAIFALEQRGWRLGLDRMQEFCRRAGLEDALGAEGGPNYIHVAGTNGKGSTTAFLQSLFVTAGYQTGAFFSPYVVDYRERVQIGRDLISEQDLAECTQELLPIAESLSDTEFGGVTKFEFEAGLGFLFWKKKKCEWVALEVGLGGRLDATNVVTPEACIVVSIGLDHVSILGDTLGKIAGEKAGIIKPGIPVVVGDLGREALDVIEARAAEMDAPVWRFGQDVTVTRQGDRFTASTPAGSFDGLHAGIEGWMQPHNAALAIAATQAAGLKLDKETVREGTLKAYAPGRFQLASYRGRELILDGAHNPQAACALRKILDEIYPNRPLHLVTNMLSGHDPTDFYRELGPRVVSADVVPIDFARAFTVEETAKNLDGVVPEVRFHHSVRSGLEAASESLGDNGLILVTGSNYVVGEVARTPWVTFRR
jgi:dihydrofolate synthase/folylpolyglutamate synthase